MVTSVVTERGHRALKTSPSRRHLAVSQVTIYTALVTVVTSASKSSIRRFVIKEKAPTRAFSWLKAATTAFTFKTLLSHYAT